MIKRVGARPLQHHDLDVGDLDASALLRGERVKRSEGAQSRRRESGVSKARASLLLQRRHQLHRSIVEHHVLHCCTPGSACRALSRTSPAPGFVSACPGSDLSAIATVANRLHRFHHLGCWNSPGTPSEIDRSAGPIMTASIPGTASSSSRTSNARLRLDLQNHHGVRVHMLDHFVEAGLFVVEMHGRQAEAANAHGRELGPAHGLFEQLRRFHSRENDSLRSAIQARGTLADTADPRRARSATGRTITETRQMILHRLQVEAAVLGVDERPMKARRRQNAWGSPANAIGRSRCRAAACPRRALVSLYFFA